MDRPMFRMELRRENWRRWTARAPILAMMGDMFDGGGGGGGDWFFFSFFSVREFKELSSRF